MRRCAMHDRQLEATLEHERGLELLGYAQWLAERDGPDRESAQEFLDHGDDLHDLLLECGSGAKTAMVIPYGDSWAILPPDFPEPAQRWLAQHGYSRTVDAERGIVYRRDDQRAV